MAAPMAPAYDLDLGGLPPEAYEHLQKVATPAHLAQYVTRQLPYDAQWRPYKHLDVINRKLVETTTTPYQTFLNVAVAVRSGKQQAIDTPILTTDGWKAAGEIEAGDEVFGVNGKPVKVLAVSPVDLLSPKMRVTTTGGASIDVHPEHEWSVFTRHGAPAVVLETQEIAKNLRMPNGRLRYVLPPREAVEFPDAELPIPPYLLGVWLGDGVASQPTLTLNPADAPTILAEIAKEGWVPSWSKPHTGTGVIHAGFRGLIQILGAMGLRGNKHIPTAYEHASVEQRRALLQGIVDTDGHRTPDERVVVSTRSESFARSVQRVASSLGYKATVTSYTDTRDPHEITFATGEKHMVKTAGTTWAVKWVPYGFPPARLPRKASPVHRTPPRTAISSVVPIEPASGVCIQVDNYDGLYLVGHELIPTHNSELISRYLPFWYLGMFPDRNVVIVSYNEEKASEWGQFVRDLMTQWGPELFGLTVDQSSSAKTYWKLKDRRGGMRSVGVGGGLTGYGYGLLIIDDPVDDPQEARSATAQKKLETWYWAKFRTRLMPNATVILTMARWDPMDLTGRMKRLEEIPGSDPWEYLTMPAIAECPKGEDPATWTDDLGRHDGEALWPEMWPVSALMPFKLGGDPLEWEALYQQRPSIPEGDMFKTANWVKVQQAPDGLRKVRFWDTAATKSKTADWTVGVLMGMTPNNEVYVLHVERFQEDPAGVEKRIKQQAQIDGTSVPIRMEQGKAGEGKQVIAAFTRLLMGFDFAGDRGDGGKEDRARPLAAQQGARNVHVVCNGLWDHESYLEEFRTFPNGRHDDQVDASTGAFRYLADHGGATIEFASPEVEAAVAGLMARGFTFAGAGSAPRLSTHV